MRRRLRLAAAVLVLGAAAVGLAAVLGAFDDEQADAQAVASRYAAALTDGSSRALAAVTCTPPSPQQAAVFDERAGGGMTWSLLRGPQVDGDLAHGTLRVVDGEQHRDYPFSLRQQDGSWCAHYNWSSLNTGG